ncbi:MAG TPA: short-chain dehydrogenase [Pseudomonas sp.]|nr:short-chain dehydrogenase [Pseudomonas sp.]
MKSFKNRVAAITGAGSGIGRCLALALADKGCNLALSDVNEAGLEHTARAALNRGVKVHQTVVNVTDQTAVHAWAEAVMSEFGKVNMIFNNAGVAHAGTVEGSEYSEFEWIMKINVWGVLYGTKAFLPHLKKTGDGHIINVSSTAALIATPGMSAYNLTKSAVHGFTQALRQELDMEDCGVSASCVLPGGIHTNIAQAARMNDSVGDVSGTKPDAVRKSFESQVMRTSAEKAAEIILNGVLKDKRRILVGGDAYVMDIVHRLFPAFYQRILVSMMKKQRAAEAL